MNIEPGDHCIAYNKAIDLKYSNDKKRKSSISFKKRRSQLHRNKLNSKSRSEAREGTTYETNVGLNLDSNSTVELLKSTNNLPKSTFEEYERMVPAFLQRKTQPKISHNDSLNYQFVVFDTETTSLGKQAQICQLAAMTKDGKTYNEYVLPTCNISSYASRVNKLTVKTVNGERTLLKENVPVHSVPLSECLQSFTTFLSSSTHCHTVLIGHNSSVFDTPTLLRCAGNSNKETLSSKNVFFADSLPLIKTLAKGGNALLNPDGKPCKSNLPSVYQAVFHEDFNTHDALEDVRALHRVLFQSPLQLKPGFH